MSSPDRERIGFDRTIRSEWLDAAVARVLLGEDLEATRKSLWAFLEDVEPGTTNNSGRGKTLTVLTRIWLSVPKRAELLKQAALKGIPSSSVAERIGIHWAMVLGTHPFFFDVATHLGTLFKLHGQANRSQIKRRMTDVWGDRITLERTIQHVLRSMAQWGLLCSGKEHGSLIGPPQKLAMGEDVGRLLTHSLLLSEGKGLPFSKIESHPALFPFTVSMSVRDLTQDGTFRIQHRSDHVDFVDLS
jgi:hypothetical protein